MSAHFHTAPDSINPGPDSTWVLRWGEVNFHLGRDEADIRRWKHGLRTGGVDGCYFAGPAMTAVLDVLGRLELDAEVDA